LEAGGDSMENPPTKAIKRVTDGGDMVGCFLEGGGGKAISGTHCRGGWWAPRPVCKGMEKRRISRNHWVSKPGRSSP